MNEELHLIISGIAAYVIIYGLYKLGGGRG